MTSFSYIDKIGKQIKENDFGFFFFKITKYKKSVGFTPFTFHRDFCFIFTFNFIKLAAEDKIVTSLSLFKVALYATV